MLGKAARRGAVPSLRVEPTRAASEDCGIFNRRFTCIRAEVDTVRSDVDHNTLSHCTHSHSRTIKCRKQGGDCAISPNSFALDTIIHIGAP